MAIFGMSKSRMVDPDGALPGRSTPVLPAPAKHAVLHLDLQRVVENEKIRLHLPLHFKGDTICPGVKTQGGIVSHMRSEVEVSCLPKDLPEFIEVDLSGLTKGHSLHVNDLKLADGIKVVTHGKPNPVVVTPVEPKVEEIVVAAAPAADDKKKKK